MKEHKAMLLAMKIFYTHEVFSSQIYGGVSRYFVELIKHLKKEADDSEFLVFGGVYINEYLKEVSNVLGIKVPPIKNTGIFRGYINDFCQRVWIKWHDPAIIHQTYYSNVDFKKRERIVITVPDMIHELYPGDFSDKGTTSILKKKSCERASKIISISNTTKRDLETMFGIEGSKITVIYLANPLEGIEPDLKSRTIFKHYLLYVGDRHGYKNFRNFITAYSSSKRINASFSLVCFGGGRFNRNEEELLQRYGVTGKVRQIGGDDHLLALYYKNARGFIYPSSYEGFGLPLLEAMSYLCPVICSTGGAIPEIVDNAGAFFDSECPDSIQAVLEKTLFDDSLLNELAVRGRERVKEFSWEKCARETLEIYRALAD